MILRDKGSITKTLILLEILQGRRKLKDIAANIDITVQGVSEYIKTMEKDGLLEDGQLTLKGLEFLDRALGELGDFVHSAEKIINKVSVTEAIAGEEIKEGDPVHLTMENGYLHAYRGEGESTGTALNSAREGDAVAVSNLRGILKVKYGKIEVYSLPPVNKQKGGLDSEIKNVLALRKSWKIGVAGVFAYLKVKKHAKIDFEFSAANSAVDAYYRGISSVIFTSHERIASVLETLNRKNVEYSLKSLE